jgi:hypothetical protein
MQHAPEQSPFDRVGMQADFVAIEFRRFEQIGNVDQCVLGVYTRLDGKQRGLVLRLLKSGLPSPIAEFAAIREQ